MKLTKKTWLVLLAAGAVLAFAFWYGGSSPDLQGWTPQPKATPTQAQPTSPTPSATATPSGTPTPSPSPSAALPSQTVTPAPSPTVAPPSPAPTQAATALSPLQGTADVVVPDGKPQPMNPEEATISDTTYTCTLSVRCDTVLDNLDWLAEDKQELIPEDGIIFPATQVSFYEGESVFNLLQREMKKSKIHLEFVNTPLYHSAYIEGIYNLYEFDCGELSGWMYRVNDWFPSYGSSRYALQDGDVVEWLYTCDLGIDVGKS